MIKNLVASCLLASSVNNTPINRNNNQWQNDYMYDLQASEVVSYQESEQVMFNSAYKVTLQKFTDYLTINATIYYQEQYTQSIQTNHIQTRYNKDIQISYDASTDYTTPQIMMVLEVTPINININNSLDLYFKMKDLTATYPTLGQGATKNVIVYEFLQTTRNVQNALNYDITNLAYPNSYNLASVYESIKNVNNGYQTNIKGGYIDVTGTGNQTRSIEIYDYRISPNKTNYYVVMLQLRQWYNEQVEKPNYVTTNTRMLNVNNPQNITSYLHLEGTNVVNEGTTEVVDIPGTMIEVIGMPFTFISTAFNLTLFPGTIYEINISLLFLTIFAILSFIFLLKILLRMKG